MSIYTERRADGWPLCPRCGRDELHSLTGSEATISKCLYCDWRSPTPAEVFRARISMMTPAEKDAALDRLLEFLGPTDDEIMAEIDAMPEEELAAELRRFGVNLETWRKTAPAWRARVYALMIAHCRSACPEAELVTAGEVRTRELERAARVHNANVLHDAIAVCQCDEAARWRKASGEAHDRLVRRGQRDAGRRP